jgi:acyl carrier protein
MLATLGVLSAKLACSQGTSPDQTFTNVLTPVSSTNLRTPLPFSPDQIEKHVKECIANRFHLEGKPISPTVELVKDLKASEIQLAGLKRQLEQDYDIKLAGQDFFKKVPTVGELIKAVQTAVKNRSAPPPEPATTLGIRPGATRGTRPD